LHHVAVIDGKGPGLNPWEIGLGSISGSLANTCSSKSKPKGLKEQKDQCEAKKPPKDTLATLGTNHQEAEKWPEIKKKTKKNPKKAKHLEIWTTRNLRGC